MSARFWSRLTGWCAALLLLATAVFHSMGVGLAKAGATEVSEPFFAVLLVPLWLFASFHWLAFAIVAALFTGTTDRRGRLTLGVLASVLLIDAGHMATAVGPFIGTVFLGACGGLLLLSAVLARGTKEPSL